MKLKMVRRENENKQQNQKEESKGKRDDFGSFFVYFCSEFRKTITIEKIKVS
jgi:hypothetical protein